MKNLFIFVYTCLFLSVGHSAALKVVVGKKTSVFSVEDLLKRRTLTDIVVKKDPAYSSRSMKYKAIPVTDLFEGKSIPEQAVILSKATDGFSATLKSERLLNRDSKLSRAYVAIEDPENPWPPLGKGRPSAGPFYLIWSNPEASDIGTEEWPFQLASLEVKDSLAALYPKIFPDPKLSENADAKIGFQLFVKNCFACHTMNKQGESQLGPDLNVPQSPTEYMRPRALKQLIRDPQSVRYWPQSKMKGFSKEELSDIQIGQIIKYLGHMASLRD